MHDSWLPFAFGVGLFGVWLVLLFGIKRIPFRKGIRCSAGSQQPRQTMAPPRQKAMAASAAAHLGPSPRLQSDDGRRESALASYSARAVRDPMGKLPDVSDPVESLRRNLLSKVPGDHAIMRRLIEYERRRRPGTSEAELLRAAIERWELDNR